MVVAGSRQRGYHAGPARRAAEPMSIEASLIPVVIKVPEPLRPAVDFARRTLVRLHPRRWPDLVKRALAAVGLLIWYWRLRALVFQLAGFVSPRRIVNTVRWWRIRRAERHRRLAETRLTVAVDITALWEPLTGIGWYLFRLLEQMAQRDDVRLRLYGPQLVDTPDVPPPVVALPEGPAIEVVRHPVPEDLNLPFARVAAFLRAGQARLIARDGNQVLFAPNYFLPEAFAEAEGRLVATVHDLSFLRVPWTMRDSTRDDLRRHLQATVARASRVLTDAETVRDELISAGLVDAALVRAVPLGPGSVAGAVADGEAIGTPPEGTPERYALHVGTIEPRKDVPTLLAAWRRLRDAWPAAPSLVLCGRLGWKAESVAEEIARAQQEGWLRHFGYLDDAQVAALYRGADLVVLASIYEGFGLPAVEAMKLGAPLLLSDIPVLREVAGEAASYVPAGDVEAWSAALRALLDDASARDALRARGRARAGTFDWQATAEATLGVWREAVV